MRRWSVALFGVGIGGVLAGLLTSLSTATPAAAGVAAASLMLLLRPRQRALLGLLVVLSAAAALAAAARDRALDPGLLAAAVLDRREPVRIEGRLLRDAALVEGGVRLLVEVDRASIDDRWRAGRFRAQLHVAGTLGAGHVEAWTAGRRVRAPASLRTPGVARNFGGPSPRSQALRRPFHLVGSIKSAALVDVERASWWHEATATVRRHVRRTMAEAIGGRDRRAAAIATAILIGDRAGLDADLERRLQMAGTYHVIAISGGNVALFAGVGYLVLGRIFRAARVVGALTLLMTLGYGAVVGPEPSVARAVTAASLYLLAGLVGWSPSPFTLLRAVALIVLVADPRMALDAAAWLSFGATAGILAVVPKVAVHLPGDDATVARRLVARPALLMLAATAAAEMVVMPIAATVFGRVTVAGLAVNLVAVPAMGLVQMSGLASVVLGWWPAAATAAGLATVAGARLLVDSSLLIDWWPWLSWRVPPVAGVWVGAYYVCVLAAVAGSWSTRVRRWSAATALMFLGIVVTSPWTSRAAPMPGRVRVTMLDVGQGEAILVQRARRAAMLVDAGGLPGALDVGSRLVTPAVWALGERRLTALAITHADRDHIGGAASVTDDLGPREVWEGVAVALNTDRAELLELAAALGLDWRTLRTGHTVAWNEVRLDVLHPPEPDWERQRVRNEDSLVLRLRVGAVDVLLTGDAGVEFESRLPDGLDAAAVRILKVGHHGSRTSTTARLIEAFRPHVALISVGRGNLYGHPSPEVLRRLERIGARVFRTDRDGAISVETDGVVVRVLSADGRTWTVRAARP